MKEIIHFYNLHSSYCFIFYQGAVSIIFRGRENIGEFCSVPFLEKFNGPSIHSVPKSYRVTVDNYAKVGETGEV